ncbi:hypothetical protein GCM10020295_81330 [Streptomyces cinereospinus]
MVGGPAPGQEEAFQAVHAYNTLPCTDFGLGGLEVVHRRVVGRPRSRGIVQGGKKDERAADRPPRRGGPDARRSLGRRVPRTGAFVVSGSSGQVRAIRA